MSDKPISILAITNLYPVPWAPHRASFNKQQFELLAQQVALRVLVLVPWREWLKHRHECLETDCISYAPYFQLPGFGRSLTPWFQRWAIARKQRWIDQAKPTHLLASWAFPDAVACLMYAKNKALPVLVKVHGTDVNEHTLYPKRRHLMTTWLSQAKTIFCASQALQQKLIAIGLDKDTVCTNYNGVHAELFYPEPTGATDKKILFVGNLLDTKGVFELVDAFHLAHKETDCDLHFIGQGPATDALKTRVLQHGLADRVTFHGALPIHKVAEHIRKAQLLVLPSYREGVPNVLLEACASGTPVVATRVGGIPEVVTEQTGILVEPQTSTALAEAILAALAKSWQKDVIVQHATRFNWHQNVQNVLARI